MGLRQNGWGGFDNTKDNYFENCYKEKEKNGVVACKRMD